MKIFFALLLIIFLAFSGYHLTFKRLKLPFFKYKFYLTGIEFLFLGLLLGPQFLNLLDTQTMEGLNPLSALLLGWIGLLFGFQFEVSRLRRFPEQFLTAGIFEGISTLIFVFSGVFFALTFFSNIPIPMKIVTAIALASAAACTAQTGLAIIAHDYPRKRIKTVKLLRHISGINSFFAITAFGTAFFLRMLIFSNSISILIILQHIIIYIIACVILFFLYSALLAQRREEDELTLIIISMAVLTSGLSSALNLSPLLINFLAGLLLVNTSTEKERIYKILISVEKPVYMLLLVILGSYLFIDSPWIISLGIIYFLYRALGKFLSGFIITHFNTKLKKHPSSLGFGLLDQGGLSLAILLDFYRGFPTDISARIVSLALITVILNNFISPTLLKRLLNKAA